MAMNLDASKIFNPMLMWTDFGLRALEMTVNSSQNVTEGVDRMARAGASVEASEAAASSAEVSRWTASALPSGVAMITDLQRAAFDVMLRGWVQVMSTLGSFASFGADVAGGALTRRNAPLDAVRKSLMLPGFETPDTQSGAHSRRQGESRRESRTESANREHALASSEPKRRRSTSSGRSKSGSKSRRSRAA